MLQRARLFVQESYHRLWRRPRRKKRYWQRTEPFLFTNAGLTFRLHPGEFVDQYIAVEGVYERRHLDYIRTFLDPDAIILDIGANIGNHALYLHRHVATVHCFEPNPVAAERLETNIELNQSRNVVVHRFGLGDRDAVLPFFANCSGNLGHSGFFDPVGYPETFEELQLPIRHADRAIAELALSRCDFIKADVEGNELTLFRGLGKTLDRFHPILAFELHGQSLPNDGFEAYSQALPGYRFAEAGYAPEGSGLLRRLLYHLRYGDRKTLRAVEKPEPRTYELLLAIPIDHPLARNVV